MGHYAHTHTHTHTHTEWSPQCGSVLNHVSWHFECKSQHVVVPSLELQGPQLMPGSSEQHIWFSFSSFTASQLVPPETQYGDVSFSCILIAECGIWNLLQAVCIIYRLQSNFNHFQSHFVVIFNVWQRVIQFVCIKTETTFKFDHKLSLYYWNWTAHSAAN